jgi:hypothetical protein
LKTVSLDSNNIGDPGARGLGAAMQVNTTLMTLMWGWDVDVNVEVDVGWGGVGGCGEVTPWQVLTITHGSLSHNNVGDETAWYLGAALQVNRTLMTLE